MHFQVQELARNFIFVSKTPEIIFQTQTCFEGEGRNKKALLVSFFDVNSFIHKFGKSDGWTSDLLYICIYVRLQFE